MFAADGRLHLWNNRFREVWQLSEDELSGHPRIDSLIGAPGRKTVTASRGNMIRELIRIATIERKQRAGQVTLADGRHYDFAAVPLPDGNALFTMLDVTDSRRIEAALRDRNEALEEGRPDQILVRRQHELRAAHPADLDRRVRRDARGRLCRRSRRHREGICRRDPPPR